MPRPSEHSYRDEAVACLREHQLKVTPQRLGIIEALMATAGSHPTAENIHGHVVNTLPMMSLKTVYQTLHDFAAIDLVHRLDLGAGSARFDINLDRHQHFVCDRCQRVFDTYADVTELLANGASLGDDFSVDRAEVVFRGVCRDCENDSTHQDPNQQQERKGNA